MTRRGVWIAGVSLALGAAGASAVRPSAASSSEAGARHQGERRITSVGVFTNIYALPTRRAAHLGYVHFGQSVALRPVDPVRTADCPAGWYAIAPRGFVCNDNTLVLQTPERELSAYLKRLLAAFADTPPSPGPLPFHYARSLGTPMYGRVPTVEEELRYARLGPRRAAPLSSIPSDVVRSSLLPATSSPPWYLNDAALSPDYVGGHDAHLLRKVAPRDSLISYQSSFAWEGRRWLITPELSVVPAENVRELEPSKFHGVELGGALQLPIAWVRKSPRAKFRPTSAGEMIVSGESWPVRSAVALTGDTRVAGGRTYWETREPGMYLAEADATLVRPSARLPPGTRSHEKWIQVSIGAGTLTAYEGDQPVFTTLISPGRGGAPPSGRLTNRELVQRASSPLGIYRIQYKDQYSVMSPDPAQKRFFISDVPHIQYFRGPFALHAAYWHDDFGEPKSGGCINLSPDDAARVFAWTEPPLPLGWHAVQSSKANGLGTRIEITR